MPRVLEPEVMDIPEEVAAYVEADFAAVNQAFVARLVDLVGARRQVKVVDLGTGPAEIPIRMVRARPSWSVVAVDASAGMIEAARRNVEAVRLTESIQVVCADAKRSNLESASFDIVCSNSLLHHMSAPAELWAEIRRLGKPGAPLLLRDLIRPASADAARQLVEKYAGRGSELLQEEFYRSFLAAFTPEEVREQLKAAGLESLEVAIVSDRHLDVVGKLP